MLLRRTPLDLRLSALRLNDSRLLRRIVSVPYDASAFGRRSLSIMLGYPVMSGGVVGAVSIVLPRARRIALYGHRPLYSGRWFNGSEVSPLNCRWEFPGSEIVLNLECNALTQEKRLRSNAGTTMSDTQTGTRCPVWSMIYVQPGPVVVANTFSLPAVTMIFGSSSLTKPPCCPVVLALSCFPSKSSDAPLPTMIVNISSLGWNLLPPLPTTSPVKANPFVEIIDVR